VTLAAEFGSTGQGRRLRPCRRGLAGGLAGRPRPDGQCLEGRTCLGRIG